MIENNRNGNMKVGNVIAVVKAPISNNRRIGERIPSKPNIDIAIDFFAKMDVGNLSVI